MCVAPFVNTNAAAPVATRAGIGGEQVSGKGQLHVIELAAKRVGIQKSGSQQNAESRISGFC